MIDHYRLVRLLLCVLGGMMLSNIGHAQGPPDEKTLILDLLDRVEQLETDIRYIRGELEVQRHQVELLQQEQERARERALSGPSAAPPGGTTTSPVAPVSPQPQAGVSATPAPAPAPVPQVSPPQAPVATPAPATAPAASAPATSTPAPATSTPTPPTTDRPPPAQSTPTAPVSSEQAAFDAALGELREGRYQEATVGFQRFLDTYPTSKLAGDAQYWLGEAHYINRDYNAAKETFINLGLHFPQSARLPDTLLKLGYIYGELGDVDRAREVLEKLVQVYPNTQAASLADRRLRSLR